MSLAEDLLEQAVELANKDARRPKQANLRRAVSAAYYALFHLLTAQAARTLIPTEPKYLRSRVQRAFEHHQMKKVCDAVAGRANRPDIKKAATATPASAEILIVARAFTHLQQARHDADYDVAKPHSRVAALADIRKAEDAFSAWRKMAHTSEANGFLIALLLGDKLKR